MKKQFLEKTKEELADFLMELVPDMRSHHENNNSWDKLPFLPEDCGFSSQEIPASPGVPKMTAYYRDGISCVKIGKEWTIKKGDDTMTGVLLTSKFAAFHFFKPMGVVFDYDKTTVPDSILMSVDEFLKENKKA